MRLGAATPVPLLDGRVLVVPYFAPSIVWMYDPVADVWTTKTALSKEERPWALRLSDGRVLMGGGQPELYDPVTDSWTYTGPVASSVPNSPWDAPHVHQLPCGDVFLWASHAEPTLQYLYRPSTNMWFTLPHDLPLDVADEAHSLMLPDGRVLVAAGQMINGDPQAQMLEFAPGDHVGPFPGRDHPTHSNHDTAFEIGASAAADESSSITPSNPALHE